MNDLFSQPNTIEAAFYEFIAQHPEFVDWIVARARTAKAKGWDRYGMKALFEAARWHWHMDRGDRDFMLNNNWTSVCSRYVMREYPDLDGFFETRKRKAA